MNNILKKYRITERYDKIRKSGFYSRFFWVMFTLLLVIHCIENTSVIYSEASWVNAMYLFRNVLYLVLLAGAGILTTFRRSELLYTGIVLFAAALSFLFSTEFSLMEYFVIMIAARKESPRKLVSWFVMIKTAAVLFTLLLWRVGILDALYYQDDDVGFYNTYGFCHRNVLAANVVVICLAWFYLRWRNIKIADVAVWCVIAGLVYLLADSRTGFIMMILIIAGMTAGAKKQHQIFRVPHIREIALCFLGSLLLLSIIGTLFYTDDSAIWKLIDSVFTKRFRFSNACFREYGVSLFGQDLPFVSTFTAQNTDAVRLILDNSFIRALLYYGLIPGALFIGTYFRALHLSLKNRSGKLAASLLLFAIFGVSERYMLDIYYQFPMMIAFAKYFFKSGTGKGRKRKSREKEASKRQEKEKTVFDHIIEFAAYVKGRYYELR